MKADTSTLYKSEDDLKARVKAALAGVTVKPLTPGESIPRNLQLLSPYRSPADQGMLQNVAFQADTLLKGVPARVLTSSPIDRMGLYYHITLVFFDANNDLHTIEVDVARTGKPVEFQQALIGVAQALAKEFAASYNAATPKPATVVTPPTKTVTPPAAGSTAKAPEAPAK